jgi:hypothetical protein
MTQLDYSSYNISIELSLVKNIPIRKMRRPLPSSLIYSLDDPTVPGV